MIFDTFCWFCWFVCGYVGSVPFIKCLQLSLLDYQLWCSCMEQQLIIDSWIARYCMVFNFIRKLMFSFVWYRLWWCDCFVFGFVLCFVGEHISFFVESCFLAHVMFLRREIVSLILRCEWFVVKKYSFGEVFVHGYNRLLLMDIVPWGKGSCKLLW